MKTIKKKVYIFLEKGKPAKNGFNLYVVSPCKAELKEWINMEKYEILPATLTYTLPTKKK